MYPDQLGLVLICLGLVAGGIYGVIRVLGG